MKSLLLLIVFVAISHQQQTLIRRLWFDFDFPRISIPLKTIRGYIGEHIGRIGWSQQRNRLLFVKVAADKKSHQPQTATLTMTSTCTSLTISTCIPRANFQPRAPAQIINCRRKRLVALDGLFTIVPTQTIKVIPTEGSTLDSEKLGNREMAGEISSSKEENAINTAARSGFESKISESQLMRNMRGFFHLWPSHSVTETTVTTWSVVSSIFTSTFFPAADFLCVPPGYQVCVP